MGDCFVHLNHLPHLQLQIAVSGFPIESHEHTKICVKLALLMLRIKSSVCEKLGIPFHVRIGIEDGPVVL